METMGKEAIMAGLSLSETLSFLQDISLEKVALV
jgi:hypothetical protein